MIKDQDKEYAISFKGHNGLDEIGLRGATLAEARKEARQYERDGATDVTIKYYEDGDLRHQWDLRDGKFVQYE